MMNRPELALALASAGDDDRPALLSRYPSLLTDELARELKSLYDASEASDPGLAQGAAGALAELAARLNHPPVTALSEWVSGMAALDRGDMEGAIGLLERAGQRYLELGEPHSAASTDVSKLIALAILGRYDEAFETGLRARDLFLATGDQLAAGKIEQNLGNIHGRREQHAESERFFRTARERYLAVGDQKQLAQIDNCLGTALKWQHRFREAERYYRQALERARSEDLAITEAEIETNLGLLALFQGRYDAALDLLERSRRRYAALEMAHESAISEMELAEAYLELNLGPEAVEMADRAIPIFAAAGMRAEQARALLSRGRALALLGRNDEALTALDQAGELYAAEGNAAGRGMVTLTRAEILLSEGRFQDAIEASETAETAFDDAGILGRRLIAGWVRGEGLRAFGQHDAARGILANTLETAARELLPHIGQRCQTSLGLLHAATGDVEQAREMFTSAIETIETLRAPLPVEEFRTAFLAGKLTPYSEIVRLCLAEGTPERVREAFEYVERARSRALFDILSGGLQARVEAGDEVEAQMLSRLEALREELNWFYSQINRPPDGDTVRGPAAIAELQRAARERESSILDLQRQLLQGRRSAGGAAEMEPVRLQEYLDTNTAVVEFFSLDDDLLAFIITRDVIQVVQGLGSEQRVSELVRNLRFQLETLRYGAQRVAAHLDQLTNRVQRHLHDLYQIVFAPLEGLLDVRRVIVIPHRSVHYVPFQALHDGSAYLIERFEISYAPSASVLLHSLELPETSLDSILLMGVQDELNPRVKEEVNTLGALFPEVHRFEGADATLAALREYAPRVDVLHLACHGYFRPDNPLFSSLRLGDGWLLVRDTYTFDLNCGIVTLSACETGTSDIAPGDEIIGLARGFISAGAPTLIVSLWPVDDEATAQLMGHFYRHLRDGGRPAAALRNAQRELLIDYPHPFYWSPFVLVGRW